MKSLFVKVLTGVILGALTVWLVKPDKVVTKPGQLTIVSDTTVVHDTVYYTKTVSKSDTVVMGDTVLITQRDTVYAGRRGTVAFDDTQSYFTLHGTSYYPEGRTQLEYLWKDIPLKTVRTNFSIGLHLPLVDWPSLSAGMRVKNNWWLDMSARPEFDNAVFKTTYGVGVRLEF